MFNFVFQKIREKHTSSRMLSINDAWDECAKKIVSEVKENSDFVMGAFLQWKLEATEYRPKILEIDGGKLFFSDLGTDDFKEQAKETLALLENENLFISRLIHELDQRRANMIELVHYCLCEKCGDSTKAGTDSISWLSIGELGKIASTLPEHTDNDKKKNLNTLEKIYKDVACGYFPNPDKECYILVYCPFLVGDNKPPGNFFGVFRGCGYQHQPVDNNPLLQLLTKVQIAGTLLFSQLSVADLLKIENNEKYQKVTKLLSDARTIRTAALTKMDELYEEADAILDPFGLWVGVDPLQRWISEYQNAFVDELLPQWGNGNAHDCESWDENGLRVFAGKFQETYAPSIKAAISTDLYEKLFFFWHPDNILKQKEGKFVGIYYAKTLKENNLPLGWLPDLSESISLPMTSQVKLGNNIPPLVFAKSCHVLSSKKCLTVQADDNKLLLSVTITNDPTLNNLVGLEKKVREKINGIIANKRIKLSSGHTSSALAVFILAATGTDEANNIDITVNSDNLFFNLDCIIADPCR